MTYNFAQQNACFKISCSCLLTPVTKNKVICSLGYEFFLCLFFPTTISQQIQDSRSYYIFRGGGGGGSRDTTLLKLDKELGHCGIFNLRETTISKLQQALASKFLSSVDLVRCYVTRILALDPYLNSVVELNPEAEKMASKLDLERSLGIIRSPLHGIPILIKDNIGTGDSMETTAGSLALLGLRANSDAEIVQRLRNAGAIILGKTNLAEFANFRGTNVPAGWSSRGNQTHNAYVLSKSPEGSSSGSAVAVGANLIPVAIGTETSGSIVLPAGVASCVGLKPTLGRVSTDGVIPLSFSQDTVGPITRNVADAATVFGVIANDGLRSRCFGFDQANCDVKNVRVGVLRDPNWLNESVREQIPAFEKILTVLRITGIKAIDPVKGSRRLYESVTLDNKFVIYDHEFKNGINEYLATRVRTNFKFFNGQPFWIRSLQDIVNFNDRFPSPLGYNQVRLIESNRVDGLNNHTYQTLRRQNQEGSKLYLNKIFQKFELHALMVPTDNSQLIPDAAGYPHITIPAGFRFDGVPFGVTFYGLPNSEEILLELALKIEKNIPARKPSRFLP